MIEDRIKVVSARKTGVQAPLGFTIVKIARPSVLANPFRMENQTSKERDRVINEFEDLMKIEEEKENSTIKLEMTSLAHRLKKGEKLALQCWCAPKKCHGDHIRKSILNIAAQLT